MNVMQLCESIMEPANFCHYKFIFNDIYTITLVCYVVLVIILTLESYRGPIQVPHETIYNKVNSLVAH